MRCIFRIGRETRGKRDIKICRHRIFLNKRTRSWMPRSSKKGKNHVISRVSSVIVSVDRRRRRLRNGRKFGEISMIYLGKRKRTRETACSRLILVAWRFRDSPGKMTPFSSWKFVCEIRTASNSMTVKSIRETGEIDERFSVEGAR